MRGGGLGRLCAKAECGSASAAPRMMMASVAAAGRRRIRRPMPPASQNTTSASISSMTRAVAEDRSAQIERFVQAIAFAPGVERREIERIHPVERGQCVHGEESFRWPVKSGRIIGGRTRTVIGWHRPRRGLRRCERAEAVEHARGRERFAHAVGVRLFGVHARSRERDHALEHVDERTRQRQIRPARIGGDMKENDHALAALRAGDERRAVGERGPGALAKFRLPARPAPGG